MIKARHSITFHCVKTINSVTRTQLGQTNNVLRVYLVSSDLCKEHFACRNPFINTLLLLRHDLRLPPLKKFRHNEGPVIARPLLRHCPLAEGVNQDVVVHAAAAAVVLVVQPAKNYAKTM